MLDDLLQTFFALCTYSIIVRNKKNAKYSSISIYFNDIHGNFFSGSLAPNLSFQVDNSGLFCSSFKLQN